jgi:NAD(P)-dependent dehydrogenase (short-subunit alcohol dehydrogenase family)
MPTRSSAHPPSPSGTRRRPGHLRGQIALVAGATRGAGRGIARALGEAGATVYCTGRSVTDRPSPYGRPETIDETAALITAAGGHAMAVRVDHTVEAEVEALVTRIVKGHGRLDVLVNSIAGEEPLMGQWGSFWQVDVAHADQVFRQALVSHIVTAKHVAPHMIRRRRGLIVEVTENDILGGGGNPLAWSVKLATKGLALHMAAELHAHRVTAVAITPGYLRSEAMLDAKGVTEANWRDAGKNDSNFLESESPLYVGRAVAALALDPQMLARTGQLWSSWELSRDYGFTDVDGRRPDWGARETIDFLNAAPVVPRDVSDGLGASDHVADTVGRTNRTDAAPAAAASVREPCTTLGRKAATTSIRESVANEIAALARATHRSTPGTKSPIGEA